MDQPALRRGAVALMALFALLALTPGVAGAQSPDDPAVRPGSTASALDDQPEFRVRLLYEAVLAREADAAGLGFWVGVFNSGVSLEVIAGQLADSPEYQNKYGVLDDAGFVGELYRNVFERGPEDDPAGVAYWIDLIVNQGVSRTDVIVQLSISTELVDRKAHDPVDRLYCAFFDRPADLEGQTFWRTAYRQDEVPLQAIADVFAQSDEFADTYGSLSNRQFVELVYKNVLGRNLPLVEVAGPNYWTQQLGLRTITRGALMVAFSEAPEYLNRWERGDCPDPGQAVPTAVDDRDTVLNGASVTLNWTQNDTLPQGTVVSALTNGSKGTTTDNGDGTFTYTHTGGPAADTDTFTYTLRSVDGVEATATVTITILAAGADGIPTARDDVVSTAFETPVDISWATNDDTDADVTVLSLGTPANGQVVNNGDNTFTYTPNAGFTGTDSFTYTLTDNGDPADTSQATVTVTVREDGGADDGINNTAVDDRVITPIDTAVVIPWRANDILPDLDFIDAITDPDHGTVVDNGNGTFTYTPDPGYTASRTGAGLVADSFSYTIRDDDAGVSTATVDVIVLAEPACEVFMNYPYLPDGVTPDLNNIELFFSEKGCFELYGGTKSVTWTGVTINGAPVTTTSQPGVELREFAPVSQAARDTEKIVLDGTATLVVDGQTAVIIEFGIEWNASGGVWTRDNSTFRGRGSDDVTILINPLV